jgi:hypothetical protein
MERRALLCLFFSGALLITGCGGGFVSKISPASGTSSITAVNVSCSPTTITPGETSQCTANVTGTGSYSTDVVWAAGAGSITSTGLYTAPAAAPSSGIDTITATSKQDNKKSGNNSVKVTGQSRNNSISSVSVTANPASIILGQTSICSATVSGNGNFSTAVTWTAIGGTITTSGVFTPSAAGTGSCTATSTQDSTQSASASIITTTAAPGQGISSGTPTLSVNATTIAFGTVNLNTSATQTLTLTSTGTAAVTISTASVTGAGFSISGATFPLTLNPNQTASLYLVFDPTVAGSATGRLTITSNSSSGATTAVSLTGTGQSVSHHVNLSWSAPTNSTAPVAGYNVFRALTGTATYQQLNASTITVTNYVDGNVQNGATYDYVVRSLDASGVSSEPSNISTAAIPQ